MPVTEYDSTGSMINGKLESYSPNLKPTDQSIVQNCILAGHLVPAGIRFLEGYGLVLADSSRAGA